MIQRDEPLTHNFVRKHYLAELAGLMTEGVAQAEAEFGKAYDLSKPGLPH